MLAAVDFDDQHGIGAEEIGDETADGHLSAKLDAVEASAA